MPIYEYYCDTCHKEFEELVFGDDIPSCPHCNSATCHKLMSRACVHHGANADSAAYTPPSSGSSKCAGCHGGNCASCH